MLILKPWLAAPCTVTASPNGFIKTSEDIVKTQEGALYPALHRLELRGLLCSAWGASDSNRRPKFYSLTAAGRKQLAEETEFWRRISGAVSRILQTA
jgi:PadR family transcriptional regulator PadR